MCELNNKLNTIVTIGKWIKKRLSVISKIIDVQYYNKVFTFSIKNKMYHNCVLQTYE